MVNQVMLILCSNHMLLNQFSCSCPPQHLMQLHRNAAQHASIFQPAKRACMSVTHLLRLHEPPCPSPQQLLV